MKTVDQQLTLDPFADGILPVRDIAVAMSDVQLTDDDGTLEGNTLPSVPFLQPQAMLLTVLVFRAFH